MGARPSGRCPSKSAPAKGNSSPSWLPSVRFTSVEEHPVRRRQQVLTVGAHPSCGSPPQRAIGLSQLDSDDFVEARCVIGFRAYADEGIDDLALVDYLAEHEITLEVCPGSNVALGVYPAWHRHPISTLLERGVKVTVSTDDPPFFHTNLVSEYENLNRTFDWDADVFKTVNMNAVRAAFCDEDTRAQLTKDLESAYG